MRTFGIDISRWQGKINWTQILSARPDIKTVIIRSSQGGSEKVPDFNPYKDPLFDTNISSAIATGKLTVGVYHYLTSCSVESAVREADYTLEIIKPYREHIRFVALDLEDYSSGKVSYPKYAKNSAALNTSLVRAFCDRVKEAGYTPLLYTNRHFLFTLLIRDKLSDIGIWYARWGVTEDVALKDVQNVVGWQYGVSNIPGLGDVDSNYFYYDTAAEKEEKETKMDRYNTVEEIAKSFPYAAATLIKLTEKGFLRGDADAKLDLSEDMIRLLVILDRADTFDR